MLARVLMSRGDPCQLSLYKLSFTAEELPRIG